MDSTRTETRKLTLGEYVDLIYILKKHLWSIEVKIDEAKEKYEKPITLHFVKCIKVCTIL